ncbi:MAG: hypothetical protein QOE70_6406 [Chthoniobacter sp.]|jgi:hypothetical protein|nr:hypothetical protein [Chthoniobacter sp.]
MNDVPPEPTSKLPFGPRDILISAAFLHLFTALLLHGFLLFALRFSHPYQIGALGGVVLFIWAWRSQRWILSGLFLLFTIAFWCAVMLPWFYGE